MSISSRYFILSLLGLTIAPSIYAQEFGYFIGKVVAEWLPDGRNMKLIAPFAYVSPSHVLWNAPMGSIVDGASIPRFAWTPIGGPFEGRYREASVIHDVACQTKERTWEDVHSTFYWAMRASGVSSIQAKIMFAAVYYGGPRWRIVKESDIALSSVYDKAKIISSTAKEGETAWFTITPGARRPNPSNEYGYKPQNLPPNTANVIVTFTTSKFPVLTEAQFNNLKTNIETNDISIEEIKNYFSIGNVK